MNALVDALACYDLRRRQIQILTVGCGETFLRVDDALAKGGSLHGHNIFFAALRAVPQSTRCELQHLCMVDAVSWGSGQRLYGAAPLDRALNRPRHACDHQPHVAPKPLAKRVGLGPVILGRSRG